jgi:hypothetical protein
MPVKDILGSKPTKQKWDGTSKTGFVLVSQNHPPRECGNCRFYKHDACHNKQVMSDPDIPDRKNRLNEDGSISVNDKECCNFFKKKGNLWLLF